MDNRLPDMAEVMIPLRQARHERGEEGVLESNARLIKMSYPIEAIPSATLSTEETSGQEDSEARTPGTPSIPPGTDAEANKNSNPTDH